MAKTYKLENKPKFKYGDIVDVKLDMFGFPRGTIKTAKVVGISYSNVVDVWLLEFEEDFGETYPYKAVAVPHTHIINTNDTEDTDIPEVIKEN